MQINSMGISIRHEDTFFIDRPTGLGDYLLLIFKSEARIFSQKEWTYVKPGSFIVYQKGSEQKYGAHGKEYINHYIHFDAKDEAFLRTIHLEPDKPAYLQNIDEIENLFRLLSRERISDSPYHRENESLLLQLLLRKVAENRCEEQAEIGEAKHLEELTNLRSEMYSTPSRYGSIKELAESVNLSVSHFQALYSMFFGISCYEDLLNAKMNGAKSYLSNNELSVKDIATLCGYDTDTCFMRAFKKRVGMTPSEFRARQRKIAKERGE